MEWQAQGFIIGCRNHGETSTIVELFSREHGRHNGLVKGGRGKRMRSILQPGNLVNATWRARLEEQLGQYVIEGETLFAAGFIADPLALSALNTLNFYVHLLPERDAHPELFDSYSALIRHIQSGLGWAQSFVLWEEQLLQELGFGLDLTVCAATGTKENLIYVSPKSGRAVCAEAGKPYHSKMLSLPEFLIKNSLEDGSTKEITNGFDLTRYFLNRYIYEPRGLSEPESRGRMIKQLNLS